MYLTSHKTESNLQLQNVCIRNFQDLKTATASFHILIVLHLSHRSSHPLSSSCWCWNGNSLLDCSLASKLTKARSNLSLFCRSMIPNIQRLAIRCRKLSLCISCVAECSVIASFGPVDPSANSFCSLMHGRPGLQMAFTPKRKPDEVMVSMSKIDSSSREWKLQDKLLASCLEEAIEKSPYI